MSADNIGEIGRARQGLAALAALKDGPPYDDQARAALAGWAGWGPLAKVFGYYHGDGSAWKIIAASALELLDDKETEAAKLAVDTAFYTPPDLAALIWGIQAGLGFDGGRVLEPGCGAGAFLDAAPAGLPVDFTGIEADPVTAAIAQALHPSARIVAGRLEKTALRRGAFDAVVGNVPFSKSGPYDPAAPDGLSLHNYFIWRALCAARPGALVTVITSRFTLDARAETRAPLGELADLVGAIRLPSTGLADGGTSVVADVLVLRRKVAGEAPGETGWHPERAWLDEPVPCDVPGVKINPYFALAPSMVAGELAERRGNAYGMTLDVRPPADLAETLADLARRIIAQGHAAGLAYVPGKDQDADLSAVITEAGEDDKERSFAVADDGTVTQCREGQWKPVKGSAELVALVKLRDAALDLFAAEASQHMTGIERGKIRQTARALYDAYVREFGPLNRCTLHEGKPDDEGFPVITRRRPGMGGFRDDPDYPTVLALEIWDDETGTAEPAPILLRHVNRAPARKSSTDDPGEALLLCLDQCAHVNLGIIAGFLNVPAAEVPAMLAGQIWHDPEADQWVTSDEYLSGNVRAKLAAAKAAAEADPDAYAGNVAALAEVQPEDLGPEEISAQLGSPWIPPADIETFIRDLLNVYRYDGNVTVRFEPYTSAWEVKASTAIRQKPDAISTWGTLRVNACNLIEDALNGTTPVVYDTVRDFDGSEKRIRNQAETALAADKIRDLQERFTAWVWEGPERADRLCALYNERFNSTRLRRFDGSLLTFPGLAGDITPYQSQKDMAWRIACTPAALCGFCVGAGKTGAMTLAAFTLRRLGLARKPAMIVPNHLLEQATAEARRWFPGGRILMVTKDDLTKDRRKHFAAKVAARDWDLVVMTHQQFAAIPVSTGTQADYIARLIEELERATMGEGIEGCRTVKKLAARKKKLIAQHEQLLDTRRDDGLTFEQTGIDVLMVDEAHLFKNLQLSSRAEGFSLAGSKRADDLMMKLSWLRDRSPEGRCGYLFTGTPLSNSLAELYVVLKYLAPDLLLSRVIESFDGFAAQFIRYITATEVAPDGSGFRQYRRPAKYANLPELRAMLGEVADIRTRADLNLEAPEVTGETVAVEPSLELEEYTAELVKRADKIRQGGVRPEEDNMLAICTDGRRAALDMRLVGVEPDSPGKVEAVVSKVAAIHQATKHALFADDTGDGGALFAMNAGCLQLVFCDQGTPSPDKGAQVYGRIRDGLIKAGIPGKRIAFIHDAKTDADKAALFARCRDGQIAVLLGSTEKCGTGVNIQHRCAAIHHVDAPWRPADVEQREGRGNRPGNQRGKLAVVRYVTERSFDAYMWQGLERKARFIGQILTGDLAAREIEDAGNPAVLSFAEIKAIATGQPLLLELSEVQAEISRLWNQSAAHKRTQARLHKEHQTWTRTAYAADKEAEALAELAEKAADGARVLSDWRDTITDPATVAETLTGAIAKARHDRAQQRPGEWRGARITLEAIKRYASGKAGVMLAVTLAAGWRDGHTFTARGNIWGKGGGKDLLAQIDAELDRAGDLAAQAEARAGQAREKAAAIKPHLDQPFTRETELKAALERRRDIEALIDAEVTPPANQDAAEQAAA